MKKQPIPDNMLTPPMLIGHISRAQRCTLRAHENDPIMTQNSCRAILFCLAREEGVTQLELSHRAGLKPPTVSVVLKKMEAEGLVYREQDKLDMRMTRVYLTEHGQTHNRKVFERLQRLDSELMRGFTPQECDQLRKLLGRMRDNILPADPKNNS